MIVSAGAPPSAHLDLVLGQPAFDPLSNLLAKSHKTCRTDPALAKSGLQSDLIGSSDGAAVRLGYIVPFGADLGPLVQPRVADRCMILAQLCIEGWGLRLPTALKAEIRAHSDLALDGRIGADNKAAFTGPDHLS